MNRRDLYKVAAGFFGISMLPGVRAFASPSPYQAQLEKFRDWYWVPNAPAAKSFSDLEAWLKQLPCEQRDGSPTAICEEISEPYMAHSYGARFYPGDEATIEGDVANAMQESICRVIDLKRPKRGEDVVLHWRMRPELEIGPFCRWNDALNDFYPVGNWQKASIYCRLAVSLKEGVLL